MKTILLIVFPIFLIFAPSFEINYKKKFSDALKEIKEENYAEAIQY